MIVNYWGKDGYIIIFVWIFVIYIKNEKKNGSIMIKNLF